MAAEEYRAIMELIRACRENDPDVLERLNEWHGLNPIELLMSQNLVSL
jgi:hypothetical protein